MQFKRNTDITIQEIDGELFLADDTNGGIYHLNVIGASFWQALHNTNNLETIVELFCNAFPDEDASKLTNQLTLLAEELEALGLIIRMNKLDTHHKFDK